MREFKVETGLEVHECVTCGINYAIPAKFVKSREEDHGTFYCPNGHKMYFPQITKEEILNRKLECCKISKEQYKKESRHYDYKARHWKGEITKLQKASE